MAPAALETIEVERGPRPSAAVIWLHGLGADGYDFVPVAEALDLEGAPAVRFVFPHAPMMPVTLNGGMLMRAWYDVYGLDGRREDEARIRASQAAVEALIAREAGRGVPARRLVLAGFSQGGAIALHTGLRHAERLAGLMILSAYVPLARTLETEASIANRDVPIFMAHGTEDPMIAHARAAASRDLLGRAGYRVEWREYPMPHAVSDAEIADIGAWLRRVLPPAEGAAAR